MVYLFLLFGQYLCRNYAVLVNGSYGFLNYRHLADAQAICHVLKRNGFGASDLALLTRYDLSTDPRNICSITVQITPDQVIPYTPTDTVDLDDNYVLNAMALRLDFLKRVGENDNILLYLVGHSRHTFFKICDRYYIFRDDIMSVLHKTAARVSRVLLILDTCEAASLIDPGDIPSNALVATTSGFSDPTFSGDPDALFGVSTIDMFAYLFLHQAFNRNDVLTDFFKQFKEEEMYSKIHLYGNMSFSVSDFFFQVADGENSVKKFRL